MVVAHPTAAVVMWRVLTTALCAPCAAEPHCILLPCYMCRSSIAYCGHKG